MTITPPLPPSRTSLCRKFYNVATNPAVLFSAGSALAAWHSAGKTGIGVALGAFTIATTLKIYQEVTGSEKGLPYIVLAGVSLGIGTSMIDNTLAQYNWEKILELTPQTNIPLSFGGSYLVGAFGHAMRGWREWRKIPHPASPLSNEQLYYGLSNLPVTQGYAVPSAIFAAGVLRSLIMRKSFEDAPATWAQFAFKHISDFRINSLGYVTTALAYAAEPKLLAACLLWTCAYANFGSKAEFTHDWRRLTGPAPRP